MDARGVAEWMINKHGLDYIELCPMSELQQLCEHFKVSRYKVLKLIHQYFGGII